MSSFCLNAEKISSANALFEELYSMVYEKLCPVPNPPLAVRNVLNNFFDAVRVVSLDDEDEDLEGTFFYSGYNESDAVFYPFQDEVEVEVEDFLDETARWCEVMTCLERFAEDVEDPEFIENVAKLNEKWNLLVFF